ncbi:MAG: AMP-dependent synthetase/ligase [Planctomycetota bacterium]|jgi:long-chain acyl-CoA synthetase
MNFLQEIFVLLRERRDRPVIREGRVTTTARELLDMVAGARAFLRKAGVKVGDRVVLIGENSARWVALDLATMFEGALVVPLYARQAPPELATMILDCDPTVILCDESTGVEKLVPKSAGVYLFQEAFAEGEPTEPAALADSAPIRIVYTSGTEGDAKGVVLNVGNVDFMLPHTLSRVAALMGGHRGEERVFHYLPCCFAGSWILLLSCLSRGTLLVFSTDLERLGEELRAADPHWMLNVPLLLERMKADIESSLRERGGFVRWLWRQRWLARLLVYPAVRRRIAPSLKALVCGSAPLAEGTQRFFMMLGLPVLQVYGLTETTAICTMDRPGESVPGRVGRAIGGIEMKLGANREIRVRGPNVFPGYWRREPHEGWLHTGDQGEVDAHGNWKIIGRLKFLLVLAGGHNVAPEPLEQKLRLASGASHVMLVGDGRKHLTALVAGAVARPDVERAVRILNVELPHYKRIRGFHLCERPFTPEDGLLTANGKLKRSAIQSRFRKEIEELYR